MPSRFVMHPVKPSDFYSFRGGQIPGPVLAPISGHHTFPSHALASSTTSYGPTDPGQPENYDQGNLSTRSSSYHEVPVPSSPPTQNPNGVLDP